MRRGTKRKLFVGVPSHLNNFSLAFPLHSVCYSNNSEAKIIRLSKIDDHGVKCMYNVVLVQWTHLVCA